MSPVPKRVRTAVYGTQSQHPLPLSPAGSRARFEKAMPPHVPLAQTWSQINVALRTQTLLWDALPSESDPCAQLHCPTAVTSVVPLVPLFHFLGAWPALPRPACWLTRSIRLGYAIQFARCPPKFRGIQFTAVLNRDAPFWQVEIAVLLANDAIEPPVPPAWILNHRQFLHIAFDGRVYQYQVLPFKHLSRLALQVNWAENLFSQFGVGLGQPHSASLNRTVLGRSWTAWHLSSTRAWFHWNSFRGCWGKWHSQPLSTHSDCFIWDCFSVGFMTGSPDGHGDAARIGSPRPAVRPWSDLAFLRAIVLLVHMSRHVVVSTDASAMG